ncbi:uncharacterized protein LOC132705232 [Cylas formicarius]|uniref:uncharacterized protein LOC132705232 n=1 Tax=Cylas formicarius TaxID=197179 RepID=UPI0029588215|nr:uncharacterized protein LOC132705232 [Cylas formicarius]
MEFAANIYRKYIQNDSNSQQSCTRPPPLEKANFDVDLANFCQTRRSVLKEFDPLYPASPCTKVVNVENESGDQTKDKLETFPMVSITPNTELPISNQVEVQSGVDAAVHLTRLLVEDETSSEQSGTNLKPRSEPTAANNIVEYKKATVNAENESEDRPKDKLETSATLSITAHEELPESNQVEVQSGVDTVVNLTPILVEDETPLEPSGSDLKPIPEPAVANTIGERKTIVKDENESGNQPNETSAIVNITPNEKLPKSNQVEVKSGADTAVKLTPILAEDETSSGQYGSNLKPRSEPTATNTIGDYKKAIVNAENESEDRPKDKLETSAVVIITPNEELPKSTQGEVKSSADAAVNLTPILVEDETSFEPSGGAFKPIPEPAVANTIEEWKTIVKDESERGDRPKETYAIVGITPYEELPKSIQVEVKSGADTAPNLTRVLVEDEISSEPSGSDTLGECTIVEAENASGNRLKYKVETSAKLILDEYEKRIAEQTKQLETLMSEKQATAKQFSNLELAFSDVFTRYEKLKVIIDKYKSNENILKLNLQSSEQALKLWEEKYQKLKKCSGDEVSRIALEKENITKEHEELHTSLRAMIKLLEIKCSSLETALMQKTRECRELEALCNDMSRKSK